MKKTLSVELLKSQTPLVLPPRSMMETITITIVNIVIVNTGGGGGGGAGGSSFI
jgi:hypothetical protein